MGRGEWLTLRENSSFAAESVGLSALGLRHQPERSAYFYAATRIRFSSGLFVQKITMKNIAVSAFVIGLCATVTAFGQDDQKQGSRKQVAADRMTLKLYPLGELAVTPVSCPYHDSLPTVNRSADSTRAGHGVSGTVTTPQGGFGGGAGGGGFGGGGFGGGGGLFSVPSGGQFGGGPQFSNVNVGRHHEIVQAITTAVDPESWQMHGGSATISLVRDILVISQTSANHDQIGNLLKELTDHITGDSSMTLDIWWLPLDAKARQEVSGVLAGKDAVSGLNGLCESCHGHHGTLRTGNGVTANIVSGYRKPLLVGRVPVIGSGAAGDQPVISHVNIGIVAEATLNLPQNNDGSKNVRLNLRSMLTDLEHFEGTETTGGDIDRFHLGNHVLETVTVCPFDRPVIAGSLSATKNSSEKQSDMETIVVVRVTKE